MANLIQLYRASKSKINLIRNFPNTIVSKGISCFAENIRNINNKGNIEYHF